MVKIVIIADCIDTQHAGIHVYTLNMIEALERSGKFEVVSIRIKNDTAIQFKNQLVVPPVIPFLQKDPLRIFFSLPQAIRKLNPNIVIEPAHFGPFNLPGKIKRVTVIHDLTPIMFPGWHPFFSSTLQRIFLPSILKKATLVITNSKNTSNDLIDYYPFTSGKIAQIYPATDPFFQVNNEEITYQKQPFFLSVGTLEPRKNLALLLDAYRLFREKSDKALQLVICGEKGWKNNIFYKKYKDHPFKNNILLKGFVSREELKQLYSTTSAFIYPSLYEGFGLPVAEAMACGAPCLISNRSGLPEVGGHAALYFQPDSPEELSNLMIQITDTAVITEDLISKGLENVRRFELQRQVSKLEEIIESLIHSN